MTRRTAIFRRCWVIVPAVVFLFMPLRTAMSQELDGASSGDCPVPLPSTLPLTEFQGRLYKFLDDHGYDGQPNHLRWLRDKQVRDTGDYLDRVSYGTHASVRVYYSPAVIAWLKSDRQGTLPDGAMIVKEQYPPPAARYERMNDDELASGSRLGPS